MDKIIKALHQMEVRMNGKLESLESNMSGMNGRLENLESNMSGMNGRLEKLEGKFEIVTNQLDRMEDSLNIVAQTASDDTISILKQIDANTSSTKQDIDYLAKQVGKHEMYFNRLNKS